MPRAKAVTPKTQEQLDVENDQEMTITVKAPVLFHKILMQQVLVLNFGEDLFSVKCDVAKQINEQIP